MMRFFDGGCISVRPTHLALSCLHNLSQESFKHNSLEYPIYYSHSRAYIMHSSVINNVNKFKVSRLVPAFRFASTLPPSTCIYPTSPDLPPRTLASRALYLLTPEGCASYSKPALGRALASSYLTSPSCPRFQGNSVFNLVLTSSPGTSSRRARVRCNPAAWTFSESTCP